MAAARLESGPSCASRVKHRIYREDMANRWNKRVRRFQLKQQNEGVWHVSVWEGQVQRPGNIGAPCVNSSSALRALQSYCCGKKSQTFTGCRNERHLQKELEYSKRRLTLRKDKSAPAKRPRAIRKGILVGLRRAECPRIERTKTASGLLSKHQASTLIRNHPPLLRALTQELRPAWRLLVCIPLIVEFGHPRAVWLMLSVPPHNRQQADMEGFLNLLAWFCV
eukprot:986537-Pelagomonas_calceolata.AAC.1